MENIQFDDLITSHHTKLKPVTIPIAVEAGTRVILAGEVAPIPAFGRLAKTSIKKYGKRKCENQKALNKVFETLKTFTPMSIVSDEHSKYERTVKRFFPKVPYAQFKSKRARIAGQGEMKKGGFDPLFSINHTLAMLRANINRLLRQTWNTTKNLERLKDHLDIYIWYHNSQLVGQNSS